MSHLKSNLNKLILHGNANRFLGFASLHILASYYQPMIERYIFGRIGKGTGVQWWIKLHGFLDKLERLYKSLN
ncbi:MULTISPECIES: hypothetical protein [Vibrio]|uniref:hypothetical protein n=1 Tax=Vibrio TaxID=662 RepID=UPI0014933F39|nr:MULTISPECIES: hypothetical protein [Vibrio]NOI84052.1 hypothetical protein [Vibrio sp. 99K-1]